MARLSEQPSSQSFQLLFQSALEEYRKKTGIEIVRHPLASQLEHCDDVEAITEVLQGQAQAFCEFRGSNKRLITSLKRTVQALHKLSGFAVLVKDIGIVCRRVFWYSGIVVSDASSAADPYCENDTYLFRGPPWRMYPCSF
jgi:hypothetical protein